jgi:hypothetical protein
MDRCSLVTVLNMNFSSSALAMGNCARGRLLRSLLLASDHSRRLQLLSPTSPTSFMWSLSQKPGSRRHCSA